MRKEVTVSLPLSEYQNLIRRVNEKDAHDLRIGRTYEITVDGEEANYLCQSRFENIFEFVSGGMKRRHIKITINENE